MPSKYSIHIVAPAQYAQIKPAIEQTKEMNGETVNLEFSGWDYSFSTLAHWAGTQKDIQPDIVLMFDVAEYPRLDEKTGGILYYAGMINCIRETRLKVDAKYVFILSSDKEENLEFLNELMKINIHNFYFAPKEFTVEDLKKWMFAPARSLKDNEKYLLAGEGLARTKVIKEAAEQDGNCRCKVKEKIVTVEKIIKEPVTVSFKKLVLSVWGNTEFACELAYAAVRVTKFNVLLANLDFISPTADIYLNLSSMLNGIARDPPKSFGFGYVNQAFEKRCLTFDTFEQACLKRRESDNLYILMDAGGVDSFDRYKGMDISGLIDCLYQYFDIVILILNKSVLDPFTVTSLLKSDYNIAAIPANADAIREFEANFLYMQVKHNVPVDKVRFAAYEYKKGVNYPVSHLKDIFTGSSFLGTITYTMEREMYRNLNSFYAKWAFKKNPGEYIDILSKLNIVPKRTLTNRIKGWFKCKFKRLVKMGCSKKAALPEKSSKAANPIMEARMDE